MLCHCGVFLLVLAVTFTAARGTVMGVDWGSEFIKISAPKGDQIDIVLNEQARRKSNNFIGFRGDDRFFGEDAKNLAPRFPNNMFMMLNRLSGLQFEDPERERFSSAWHLSTRLLLNEKRGTINVAIEKNPNVTFTLEELLAMQIAHMKETTEKDTGHKVTTAVFTVPSFFNSKQRQALVDSAELVGIRVLALMHSTTATALQFGMGRRGFGNDTVNLLVYDIGSSKAEVGIYTFTPTPQPKEGRVKLAISLGVMTTRAIVSDGTLGGRTFDACIAKMLEDEFIEKNPKVARVLGGPSLAQQKAAFSLMRAANGAKERLSANTFTPVTVEGMSPDRDFTTKLEREAFEHKCAHLFDRVVQLAKSGIEQSGLQPSEIHSFEMMGGGVRPPKIVEDLSALIGRPVDRTLNSDEAAAMGAGYYGARLASFFRVKSFDVRDHLRSTIAFELSPPFQPGSSIAKRVLFDDALLGSRRSVTVKRVSDFALKLLVSSNSGESYAVYGSLNVTGVNDTLARLGVFAPKIEHENNTVALRVQLKLEETGLVTFEEGAAKFRYVVNASKKVRVNVTDTESDMNESSTSESEPSTGGEDGQEKADENSENRTNTTAEVQATKATAPSYKYEVVHRLEMRRKTLPLDVTLEHVWPLPMSTDDRLASLAILKALDDADALKRATSTAKNDLETYIQWAKRDGILESELVRDLKFMSAEEAEAIRVALDAAQEWVEDGEGSYDSCTKDEFDKKLLELKSVTEPVTERVQKHEDHLAEIRRNETLAKEKAKRDAKKASKNKKNQKKSRETSAGGDEDSLQDVDAQENSGESTDNDGEAQPNKDDL